jgi:hypothetical protein
MTQDEVAILWKDANGWDVKGYETTLKDLERFAKLVAAKEREACKALAKEHAAEYKEGGRLYPMLNGSITKTAATACDHIVYIIGERGQA